MDVDPHLAATLTSSRAKNGTPKMTGAWTSNPKCSLLACPMLQMVGSEIYDLLRRAWTLERQRRLGEHRAAPGLQFLQAIPSVGDVRGRIVAADPVLAQRLNQADDPAPIELHAGANHEVIVGQSLAVLKTDRVLLRLEDPGGAANPTNADGDQAFFRTFGSRQRTTPAPTSVKAG